MYIIALFKEIKIKDQEVIDVKLENKLNLNSNFVF